MASARCEQCGRPSGKGVKPPGYAKQSYLPVGHPASGVVSPVVLEPTPDNGIEHPRQILDRLVAARGQFPASKGVANCLRCLIRDRRTETAFAFGDVVDGTDATDICSITEQPSLSPRSPNRTAVDPPYG